MRILLLILIAITPFNRFRIFLYRTIFKFKIDYKSKIGLLNLLNCKHVEISNSKIGFLNQIVVNKLKMEDKAIIRKFNRIKNLNELSISKEGKIDSKNFIGGPGKDSLLIGSDFKKQNLFIGERSSVLRSNYFDIVRDVKIGSNVVFGGNGSEIWTHGFDTKRVFLYGSIEFGNNIFVGSNCVFTKGVSICDEVSIASASVIYKSITEKGVYTSHKMEKIN